MEHNFSVTMDNVYHLVGNVTVNKIVLMEKMKTSRSVVSVCVVCVCMRVCV